MSVLNLNSDGLSGMISSFSPADIKNYFYRSKIDLYSIKQAEIN